MAERHIRSALNQGRRSILSLAGPVLSYDALVTQKLQAGKFLTTKTGWIKVTGVLILLIGVVIFVSMENCSNVGAWYPYLFPSSTGANILVQSILYLIFVSGATVKGPGKWIKADIILNGILAIVSLISSVFTSMECKNRNNVQKVSAALGIAGSAVSLIGCVAILLLYRYKPDADEDSRKKSKDTVDRDMDLRRQSMHA